MSARDDALAICESKTRELCGSSFLEMNKAPAYDYFNTGMIVRCRINIAKENPLIKCHTPHHAATKAMSGLPSKNVKIKIKPSPEF